MLFGLEPELKDAVLLSNFFIVMTNQAIFVSNDLRTVVSFGEKDNVSMNVVYEFFNIPRSLNCTVISSINQSINRLGF